ncbi:hypothetical protein HPB47_024452 [Ixodes persulcatus]|uniref:Uncharacterized protein n=1 Tax=Ixodes persulcatus TaxID=34615 RepID=A0AC60Q4F3_IXOPE|nr:hypothetical protein HPB47_024452 [Ixodes persulcatus]
MRARETGEQRQEADDAAKRAKARANESQQLKQHLARLAEMRRKKRRKPTTRVCVRQRLGRSGLGEPDQDIGMNELLEFSFDRIDQLAETCGTEVSVEQKEELLELRAKNAVLVFVFLQMEKSDWLSPSKVSADRPRTSGSWEDSIGPPPPSPVFGFANDSPVESSPRSSFPAARAVTSPGAESSTSRLDVIREGQGQTPRCHKSMLRPLILKLSPIGAPGTRSSKRPVGQRIKSFFTGTVSWKVPHDQRLARRDHKSKLRFQKTPPEKPSPWLRSARSSGPVAGKSSGSVGLAEEPARANSGDGCTAELSAARPLRESARSAVGRRNVAVYGTTPQTN